MAKTRRVNNKQQSDSDCKTDDRQLDIEQMINIKDAMWRIQLKDIQRVRARISIRGKGIQEVEKGELLSVKKTKGRYFMFNEENRWDQTFLRKRLAMKELAVVCYG